MQRKKVHGGTHKPRRKNGIFRDKLVYFLYIIIFFTETLREGRSLLSNIGKVPSFGDHF